MTPEDIEKIEDASKKAADDPEVRAIFEEFLKELYPNSTDEEIQKDLDQAYEMAKDMLKNM